MLKNTAEGCMVCFTRCAYHSVETPMHASQYIPTSCFIPTPNHLIAHTLGNSPGNRQVPPPSPPPPKKLPPSRPTGFPPPWKPACNPFQVTRISQNLTLLIGSRSCDRYTRTLRGLVVVMCVLVPSTCHDCQQTHQEPLYTSALGRPARAKLIVCQLFFVKVQGLRLDPKP